MKSLVLGLLVLASLALPNACRRDGGGGSAAGAPPTAPPGGTEPPPVVEGVTRTYVPAAGDVLNPERGFYDWVDLVGGGGYGFVRANGWTLAYAPVQLDAFRNSPISSSTLASLEAGFARAREAGIKVILRCVYNSGFSADAPKDRVLQHIQQLAPVLTANADVIALVQGGFIGAWGEWHSSTNGLDNPTDRRDILTALLQALPASRMVDIRTPHFKEQIYGSGPISEAEAFSGTLKARTGHHNDCFLSSSDDVGTYQDPIESWKDYVAQDGRFTPIGGETCGYNPPRSDGPAAEAEMERLHFSYLNIHYEPTTLQQWIAQGYFDIISARLGYRLTLQQATFTPAVRPGGVVDLEVRLANTGFASLFNPRPVFVVLDNGTTRLAAQLSSVDPRRWEAGAAHVLRARVGVPGGASPGPWRLGLWMPDEASSIRSRPEYAVRFANDGVWDPATGFNVLANDLVVDPAAGGPSDPAAPPMVPIP
ncbi:MAG: DUF4832 domain-containing protein [Planctomycetes bacterium]|nr:DUF4832 domain-containing protein [Planctomycetota bacterium]